jgi:E3 ubiquitin-protein ligase TRIP12
MMLQNILAGMKDFDDEAAQLSSLSELCELLSISSEESLATFPIEQIVPVLVRDYTVSTQWLYW